MTAFASFFVDFIWTLIKNIGNFFASIGIAIYDLFVRDVKEYFDILGDHAGGFDALGWIFFIVVALVNTVFVVFLIYRLIQLIRRYIIYRAKNVEKDKLLEEIAKLKLQAEELSKEKGKVFASKLKEEVEPILKDEAAIAGTQQTREDFIRFASLTEVDHLYEETPSVVKMAEADCIPLREIVQNIVAYSASKLNLYYDEDTIRQFFAALATSKLVLLEGITGAGKTSLPHAVGCYFNRDPMIVPITTEWNDRSDLLGYYDDLSNQYEETEYLAQIYAAGYRQEPNLIVLDDINLARIEYYFSDFLALFDNPDVAEWKIDLVSAVSKNDPKNISYGKLLVSQNIWFVGTANTDQSTFTVSEEVYDRAMMIQLNEMAEAFEAEPVEPVNCSADYLITLFERAQREHPVAIEILHRIEDLDTFMGQRFSIKFGTRLMKQLMQFVSVYVACGGKETDGVDIFICNKILRRLVPLNLKFLVRELNDLIVWFNRAFGERAPRSVEYVKTLLTVN